MMIIGNTATFAFQLVPVTPSWERRYAPERAAWAGTAIWVAGKNLCSHVVPGSTQIQNFLYIPLAPIVDWLVRSFPAIQFEERAPRFNTTGNLHESVEQWGAQRPPDNIDEEGWWDAREEWWSRHFLRAGADGARVPNLALARADEKLTVTWAPPRFFGDDAPAVLGPQGEFELPWNEGRSVLEQFASSVAESLRRSGAADVYWWAREQHPLRRAMPDLSRAIELFTARPPDTLEGLFGVADFGGLLNTLQLDSATLDPAASPQCQVLRDLSPTLSEDIGEVLSELGDAATREEPEAMRRWRRARRIAQDAARAAGSPDEAGQLAAPEIRRALKLDSEPIDDLPTTLTQLGLSYTHTQVESRRDRMMVALRDGGSPVATTLQTPRTAKTWGQRFEACRALGHILLDPIRAGTIGAASGPYAEETRRRRAGAFAAELLLPETAIAKASADRVDGAAQDDVFTSLLERYGIGATAAANQIWNRHWLSSLDVRDDLVERIGSPELA